MPRRSVAEPGFFATGEDEKFIPSSPSFSEGISREVLSTAPKED